MPARDRSPKTHVHLVTVAEFERNKRGERLRVALNEIDGKAIADIRVLFTDKFGALHPTKKGVSVMLAKLPELANALNLAVAEARRLGLLKPEGGR